MKKIAPVLILIISILLSCLSPAAATVTTKANPDADATAADTPAAVTNEDGLTVPDITAKDVVLADLDTGKIVYSKDMDAKAYPASLTKMMTVLLAVEAIEAGKVKTTDEIPAYDDCRQGLTDDSSTENIQPGEVLTLEQLMYCALVASANEACNIIAEYIGGSIDDFVGMMNDRAKALGCTGTHFANPNGMPDDNHYTTAHDLYLIAKEALKHDLFVEICGARSYTVPGTNMSDERILYNSNALLSGKGTYGSGYIYEHAYGIKTGYTDSAGYCLVSAAKNNDMNLICVVLGCSSKTRTDGSTQFCNFSDTINLYQWVFENYKYHKVCTVEDLVAQATVKYAAADGNTVNLRPEKEVSVLAPASIKDDAFTSDIKIYSDVTAPVDAGQVLGTMEVKMNGKAVATVNLVAVTSVDMSQSQYFKDHIHSTFSNIWVKIVFWLLIILIGAYVALVVRYRLRRQRHLRDQRRARQAREKAREKAAAERLFRDSGGSGRMDTYRPGDYPGPRPVPRGGVDSTQKDYFDDFFRREEETEKKKK